ncbi:c-type cytochrome [Acanthopleuribacter pedis]|uniref:Cytochrome c4 n=1 Tax=Acanthopleuribacter pedis TaxID=442870 RepID=A0A8J7Q8A4_9BACT|nr:cytochrome c4 [Acanthopleuribacter pedis]MBO1320281.1 cytochrome c4 [Acanthopleuribacter pedis]
MKRFTFGLICMLMLTGATLWAAGDATKGKTLYTTCITCHGADGAGNKALNSPQIAGQEDWYLERQLKNFKSGVRGSNPKDTFGMQMRPMAMTLTNDQAIQDVIAYIKTLKPKKLEPTLTGGDATRGKSLYAVCVTCHGANAEGNKALNAPKLTGLQDWYQLQQLKLFKNRVRGADPKDTFGMQMAPMAMTLANEQAMKDVIAYIKTLK